MNAIFKSKSTRLLSALLSVLMIFAILPTTAFAWSAEEGTQCTSAYGDKYLGSDGDYFYSKPTTTAIIYNEDGSFHAETSELLSSRRKHLIIDGSGNKHEAYCIESGVDFFNYDSYGSSSGKNSRYFQNLPVSAQYGIMLALMYGWHEGMTSPVPGTSNDDFAFATQCIIWEYQQQLRTSPTSIASNNGIDADTYNHTIMGRPAELCYNWILEQMSKHSTVPSFSSRSQSGAQTYTMLYDSDRDEYSITLTDANNTMADISFSDSGITVTRSGNRYTFTSKSMISGTVTISAQKKTNLGMGKMLIWGYPGKQTMASGAEDPVFFFLKLKTETKGVGHIVKTSEDGKVEGIKFTITGNGINETVTTGKNGTVDLDLLPGTYTVTELPDDKYETQAAQTVTIVSGKNSTVTFSNTLRRGDLKVTKTAEDGLNEGLKFHLYGTSYCGLPVDEYAVTNASGVAVFDDVLIGTG
ncbi:MAG: Cys-Gln thioester bond-forming surface protein, partial [Firmicutes bacterium]|nr:Cys-Gln thioester bond-forming surface protein [Bacillota bacterium]